MTEDGNAWSNMVATVDTLVNKTQGEKVRTRIVIYRTICYSSLVVLPIYMQMHSMAQD